MAKAGRKKKEEVNIVSEENISTIEPLPILGEKESKPIELNVEKTFEEKVEEMPEVEFLNPPVLSDQAIKWEKYISMYKYTPERFLERYPNHPNKRFIEELIAFKKL